MLTEGKANVLIDGQFGSTGKGLMAGYIGSKYPLDVAVTNASANAGHTCIGVPGFGDKPVVLYHLPMSHLFQRDSLIYLNAGAVIDPDVLSRELEEYNINTGKLRIHPRAAVITKENINAGRDPGSMSTKTGGTQHGVSQTVAAKALRSATLAGDHVKLKSLVGYLDLNSCCDSGQTVFIEVPQGFSLGINSGLSYPYCTSREVSVTQALADAQVHPSNLGKVTMTMRTYPIRVGNIYEGDKQVGWSGPWYDDQRELSWEDVGVKPELTTVTKRPRRVASFSMTQYKLATWALRPDYVFLNFVNYMDNLSVIALIGKIGDIKPVTHVGWGPTIADVREYNH